MTLLNNNKEFWPINRVRGDAKIPNRDGITPVAGKFLAVSDMYLPNTIKYIAYENGLICFVTYDDLYSIKYMKYWRDSEGGISRMDIENAKLCFESQKYPHVDSNDKIYGIQVTVNGLFALISESEKDNIIYVI